MLKNSMNYKASPIGNEISCVMYGINKDLLNNHENLRDTLIEFLKQEEFTILKQASHKFKPQGYTLTIILAESISSISTYPEYNSLHFYIYSCRSPEDGRKTYNSLKQKLSPKSISYNERNIIVDEKVKNSLSNR